MPTTGGVRPTVTPALPLSAVARLAGAHDASPATRSDESDQSGQSGQSDVRITGATLDSRAVRPGDLYAALPGSRAHGASYCDQARSAGAVAVLTDLEGARIAAESGWPAERPVVVVPRPRAVLGRVSAGIYGDPALGLVMLGVTGTNGKTTTTYLIDAALRAAGQRTGLVGTVETRVGDERLDSVRTTPEAPELQALLAVMRERGCTACAMEVSSHALALNRVDGVRYDVAGFTNLSQDHLDFHQSQEEYFQAKASLFTPERARRAVVCVDDEWGVRLAGEAGVPVTTLATSGEGPARGSTDGRPADWNVTARRPGKRSGTTDFDLTGPDSVTLTLTSPLVGGYNVANTALAALMLRAVGQGDAEVLQGLASAVVPGRMQRVPGPVGAPLAIVDFAHTAAAVGAAAGAVRAAVGGRLVIVLGAGGDRDHGKRAPMGQAAAEVADVVVVTDDNPRSERPEEIRAEVLRGARSVDRDVTVVEVGDRRSAIEAALGWARDPADAVLVAGKGHERGQEVAGQVLPFDDREVLAAALARSAPDGGPR